MVALSQLVALGISARAVSKRVGAGRLHRIHRGVYAVGHTRLPRWGTTMAAVLACGPGAVISHRSAAAVWGLRPSSRALIEVSSATRSGRCRPGIAAHRGGQISEHDVALVEGIPCTSVARTLLDLAEVVDRGSVERAVDQAEVLRVYDGRAVEKVLECAPGHRGAAALRHVLEAYDGPTLTRSGLERLFLALCAEHGIPKPEVNAWLAMPEGGGYEPDFLWRDERLIAEGDSRSVHGTRRAFEEDRLRDRRLSLAGWRVVRCSSRQVKRAGAALAADLHGLLALPPAPAPVAPGGGAQPSR